MTPKAAIDTIVDSTLAETDIGEISKPIGLLSPSSLI
jgi:hypothetical protein